MHSRTPAPPTGLNLSAHGAQDPTLGHYMGRRGFQRDAAEIGLKVAIYPPINSVLTFSPPDSDGALRWRMGRCAS